MAPLGAMWRLANEWYGNRLDPHYRPRTVGQSQRLLTKAGLATEFWQLA